MAGRLKLDNKGVQQMLKDTAPILAGKASAIAAAAGPGHESEATAGRRRALASVWTTSSEAAMAEAEDANLTRAISAGNG